MFVSLFCFVIRIIAGAARRWCEAGCRLWLPSETPNFGDSEGYPFRTIFFCSNSQNCLFQGLILKTSNFDFRNLEVLKFDTSKPPLLFSENGCPEDFSLETSKNSNVKEKCILKTDTWKLQVLAFPKKVILKYYS